MTAITLREAVAAQISAISPKVQDAVVAHLVEIELRKRTDAIVKGVTDLTAMQKERDKIARPDSTTFNADGSKASETYTKARLDQIVKVDKKIDKLSKALDKAIAGDMGDLANIGKGSDEPAKDDE